MKKFLLTFWPEVCILVVWLIFVLPYFLTSKTPFPSMYQVNNFAPWSAYTQFAGPVKNGAMPDVITQILPWRFFSINSWKQGQVPLWNPFSFSGTPHLANYQSASLTPFNFLFFILPFNVAWTFLVLIQPLLAGIFMYLFVSQLKVSKFASLLSSLAFMFCGFIVTWMDYATLGFAIIFLPFGLFAIEKYFQTKSFRYCLLLGLTFPMSFFSGHFQTSIYFAIATVSFLIFKLFQSKNIRLGLNISLSLILGFIITFPQLLPSIEFYTQSLRSNIFQKSEVIPWQYLATLFAPDFFGNPVTRNDWFGHYAEWNGYIGLVPLLLSLFSLGKWKNSYVKYFFLFGIISLVLTLPTPLSDLLVILHIPVLSTSSLSRIIVLFSFSFAVVCAYGLDFVVEKIKTKKLHALFPLSLIYIILFAIFWAVIFGKLFLAPDKILIARQNLILPTLFFGVFLGILCIFYFIRKAEKIFVALIILLTIFDLLRFSTKWLPKDPVKLIFAPTKVADFFKEIPKTDRVIGNLESGICTYYGISCLGGYDPLYIDRYGTFVYSFQKEKIDHAERSVVNFPKSGDNEIKTLDFLGVSYVIHKTSDDFVSWTFPYWQNPGQFEKVFDDGVYKVFKNTGALPRVFMSGDYLVSKSDQEIINKMFEKSTDLEKTLILEANPNLSRTNDVGTSTITSDKPDLISIRTLSKSDNLLFISDPFYPDWKAFVDGKETKIMRADFAFRAIAVPKGTHEVLFRYEPSSFKWGVLFAIAGLIGFGFMSVYSFQTSGKKV